VIAEIFFEQALTANGFLEALLAIALPELDVHAAGSDQACLSFQRRTTQ
jgi:hypothetical protein